MKSKKLDQKLSLNKKTIADLCNREMEKIQGGIDSGDSCPICRISYNSRCDMGCMSGAFPC